jgi:hypothetical protein
LSEPTQQEIDESGVHHGLIAEQKHGRWEVVLDAGEPRLQGCAQSVPVIGVHPDNAFGVRGPLEQTVPDPVLFAAQDQHDQVQVGFERRLQDPLDEESSAQPEQLLGFSEPFRFAGGENDSRGRRLDGKASWGCGMSH